MTAPPHGLVMRGRPSIVAMHAISPRGVHAGNAMRGDPARLRQRPVGGDRPQLLPVAAVDDAGDEPARTRPGQLTQVGHLRGRRLGSGVAEPRPQRIAIGPQPLPRAGGAIVQGPPGLGLEAVGENPLAVRTPGQVPDLGVGGRQRDAGAASSGTHAQESPLGVRDPAAIRRDRPGRVAIADGPELVRVGDPCQRRRIGR